MKQKEQSVEAISYKNNSSKRTRSNSDLISLNNFNLETPNNNNEENVTIEKEGLQKEFKQEEVVSKNTGYIGKNGFLGRIKGLHEMITYLTDSMCSHLRLVSKREFSNNAISEILQNIINKGYKPVFLSIKGFIEYMTKALIKEMRDAVKTAGDNYYIKANKTTEELKELAIEKDIDQYLDKTEQVSIINRTDETQFKARIAGKFSKGVAYNFLKSLRFIRKMGNVLELHLLYSVSLTPSEETRLLWEAQSIGGYSVVEKLQFII